MFLDACVICLLTRKRLTLMLKLKYSLVSNQTPKVMLFMIFNIMTLVFLEMLYFYENRFPYIHSFEENENILHIPLPNYFSDQVGFIDDFPEENNTNIYIPNAS